MEREGPLRVLIAKWELESHDRGARMLVKMLVDSGMEVIYYIFKKPEDIVTTALEEDVDVIGLSSLSGEMHNVFIPEIMRLLDSKGLKDVLVIAGGRIPPEDASSLLRLGVGRIFEPGSLKEEIVNYIKENTKGGKRYEAKG